MNARIGVFICGGILKFLSEETRRKILLSRRCGLCSGSDIDNEAFGRRDGSDENSPCVFVLHDFGDVGEDYSGPCLIPVDGSFSRVNVTSK